MLSDNNETLSEDQLKKTIDELVCLEESLFQSDVGCRKKCRKFDTYLI